MIRKTAMLTFVFLLTAATGFAEVKLERKFPEGQVFTTQSIAAIDQTLTIAGSGTETKVETITMTEATIGKRDADGNLPVDEKVKSLQITIGGTPGEYSFDSVNPDKSGTSQLESMRGVHKAIASRTVTIVHGADGRVTEIKADEDALGNVPDGVRALAKSQFDPEYLKQAANQKLDMIPSKAVNKGDSWERTSNADFGAGQMMEFETKYTYEGTVETGGHTLDKITAKTFSVEFSLADDSPLPITLKDSQLMVKESAGVLLFDRKLGRIVEYNESLRITGGLTFDANGRELPSELDLKMRVDIALQR